MNRVKTKATVASALLAASALLLSACGSGAADAAEMDMTIGPLDELTARIHGFSFDPDQRETQQEAQARIEQEGRLQEEYIAACMADLGFTYIPREDNFGSIWLHDGDEIQWGTLEFAETFGFGVSTDPWGFNDPDHEINQVTEFHDPNAEIIEAMSPAELEAWTEALWGAPQDWEAEDFVWDPLQAGCSGAAQVHVLGSAMGVVDDQFASLNDELNNFWQTMQSDSRIVRLNADWASCMADAGYTGWTDANELQMELHNEWGVLQGWNDPEFNALLENWDWEADPEGPAMPEPSDAEVAAFTEREIALAVADFHCRADIDFDGITRQVNLELQQEFVDRHGAELEAWAQYEEARRDG